MTDQADLPDFELPAIGTQRFQLSAFKGHPFVIHFYPQHPGLHRRGHPVPRPLYAEFQKSGIAIFGVSRDSLASHEGFLCGPAQQALDFVTSAKL